MATIPVSNTYARALAPSINLPSSALTNLPVSSLSGLPAPVGLLQGSIPQITPTQGMLNFKPISIDESGWNLPSSSPSFNVWDYVKDYFKKQNNPPPPDPLIPGSPGTNMAELQAAAQKKFYPKHTAMAKEAGAAGIMAYYDGTHSKWQDKIKQEMVDLGVRDKYVDPRTGMVTYGNKFTDVDQKYSSGQWKDYLDKKAIEY